MARATPQVTDDRLTGHGAAAPVAVGSPAWFAWLEQASRFAFRGPAGTFTARREAHGRGAYWRAYRTVGGRQRRAYLGRSADLTAERLRAVAAQLAADPPDRDSAPVVPAAPTPFVLLATKLYIPRPGSMLIPRPRLLARLDAGLRGQLTVIAAPAGFGKTTLLAEWIASRTEGRGLRTESIALPLSPRSSSLSPRVAWLTLDAADNDPIIFLRYLIAALRTVMPPSVGAMALALLEAAQLPPLTTLLTTLINDLAGQGMGDREAPPTTHPPSPIPLVLVLDDYHVITTPAIHEALTFLLDHLPPTLHLVIASREDPPLPLARLRVRGRANELRAADLRFTRDEAAAFLRDSMRLAVSADDVAALEARTEGWAAGLQLAALALHDRADQVGFIADFTGSNRFVVDYLAAEVLDRLPPHQRAFVLQTSILERMCAPLCDTLFERQRVKGKRQKETDAGLLPFTFYLLPSQQVLEELERANLFLIPLDDQRRWYRYHQLFADVLRERLARDESSETIAELHRRASAWFERHGLAVEAIRHALAAGDPQHAASLIEPIAMRLALEGQQATAAGWLAQLPPDLRRMRPRLALAYACVAGFNADYAAAEAYLREAEAAAHTLDESQAAALRTEVAALRAVGGSLLGDPHATDQGRIALAHLDASHPLHSMIAAGMSYAAFATGDLASADQTLRQALAAQPAQRGPDALQAGLVAMLAMVRRAQGRLHDVQRMAMEVLDATSRDGHTLPLSGAFLAHLLAGLTQCEQNQLDSAEGTLRRCAELAGQYQMTMYEILAQFYMGHVLAARGDLDGALQLVEGAEARAGRYLSPLNLRELVGYRVLLWLRQGNLAAATAWAAQDSHMTSAQRPRLTAYDNDRFALAHLLIAQGRWDDAEAAVARLLADAESSGHGRFVIWALVLRALLLQAKGDTTAALQALERALALGEPEGYVRIFADQGAPLAALLQQAAARGIAPAYVEKLQAALPRTEGQGLRTESTDSLSSVLSPQSSSLVEPLSARELEVLRMIAAGDDNAQIARALIVAVSTIKSHINHIFGKLGARNRVDAVRRAQELGLL
jgi:LuxR family maltose regulon positive regulatory protein